MLPPTASNVGKMRRSSSASVAEELRKRRLEFLGIYHSHPNWLDTNEPSPKDIALAHYSEAIYFIVTPRPYATTLIRGFSIRDRRAMEVEI
jgi:proteasome lid subunit RPN8/RPN11